MREEIFLPATYAAGVPYAMFRRLREETPVAWIPEPPVGPWPAGTGYWAVLRHADVRHVLRTPADFSSHLGATQIRDPDTPEDLEFVRAMMLNQDPPSHSRPRRIVAAAFTPRAVRALEETIRARARALVSAAHGEVDFVELAADLPVWTLAHIMGVPDADRRLLFDWASRIIGYQDADYADLSTADTGTLTPMGREAVARRPKSLTRPDGRPMNPRSRAALRDMFAYAHALAAEKRRAPGEDIMSRMLSGGLTTAEFENMFFLFAVAGNETLRNGVPGGLLTLLEHPAELARLRADPSLLPTAVEEMLRYWPPVMDFRRTATRDLVLADQKISAGDKVVVYHASANRDPAVFPDPDRFDVARAPNDHVSFGHGPHFCLGAHLARTQMRAIFTELLPRGITLTGEPVRMASNFQNGLKHLPIRLD
ncbi:cytochrome P450 [Actinomadura namibiensis]|uniref:Cytochrome P450 n=1 Tax=Actinomadura namibiensis TaxID=182080 RepID=A0A7W3QQ91_ACTNM|nr:cytochrome P450 [Actinomadura namibiensis]MBA8955469.1 cytochrome P450 [Actinomadura namibiensis]